MWLKNVISELSKVEGFPRIVILVVCFLLCAAIIPVFAYFWFWYAGIILVIKYVISPVFDMGPPMRLLLVILGFISIAIVVGVMSTNHASVIDVVFWPYPIIYKAIYNYLSARFYGFGDHGEMTIVMGGLYIICGITLTMLVLIFSKLKANRNIYGYLPLKKM